MPHVTLPSFLWYCHYRLNDDLFYDYNVIMSYVGTCMLLTLYIVWYHSSRLSDDICFMTYKIGLTTCIMCLTVSHNSICIATTI